MDRPMHPPDRTPSRGSALPPQRMDSAMDRENSFRRGPPGNSEPSYRMNDRSVPLSRDVRRLSSGFALVDDLLTKHHYLLIAQVLAGNSQRTSGRDWRPPSPHRDAGYSRINVRPGNPDRDQERGPTSERSFAREPPPPPSMTSSTTPLSARRVDNLPPRPTPDRSSFGGGSVRSYDGSRAMSMQDRPDERRPPPSDDQRPDMVRS